MTYWQRFIILFAEARRCLSQFDKFKLIDIFGYEIIVILKSP